MQILTTFDFIFSNISRHSAQAGLAQHGGLADQKDESSNMNTNMRPFFAFSPLGGPPKLLLIEGAFSGTIPLQPWHSLGERYTSLGSCSSLQASFVDLPIMAVWHRTFAFQ